jgi:hypothetical protein
VECNVTIFTGQTESLVELSVFLKATLRLTWSRFQFLKETHVFLCIIEREQGGGACLSRSLCSFYHGAEGLRNKFV